MPAKNSGIMTYAVILAGGFGTRLRPITDYVPKPLVPINNVPILEWQIKYLKKFGIKDIIICTGYKTQQIQNLMDVKSSFGVNITISVEKTPLGTGGAIKKAVKHITDKTSPIIVLNGDIITNINLKTMFKTKNSIAGIELQTRFGTLDIMGNKINMFNEKKPIRDVWMNAGIYHLTPDVLKHLPSKGEIEKTIFPKLAKQGNLHIVKFRNVIWFSIDSYKDIQECSAVVDTIIKTTK